MHACVRRVLVAWNVALYVIVGVATVVACAVFVPCPVHLLSSFRCRTTTDDLLHHTSRLCIKSVAAWRVVITFPSPHQVELKDIDPLTSYTENLPAAPDEVDTDAATAGERVQCAQQ